MRKIKLLLKQHVGAPCAAIVKPGDKVEKGTLVATPTGLGANIFSSVYGTVEEVTDQAIVIQPDDEQPDKYIPIKKSDSKLEMVKEAGIVGMGGAGFPTHVKLTVKTPEKIDYVIANGAECEPYITCDDQLMRTKSSEIVEGMEYMLRLFPNAKGVVVVENNKPEAIAAMEQACQGHDRVYVQPVKTKYPQGGERSLITVITGKHLKLGMLPADAGCVVDNVATIYAIYRAVKFNEPLMERGFTVSGDAVQNPGNFIVKIGTSHQELVDACGGFKQDPKNCLLYTSDAADD